MEVEDVRLLVVFSEGLSQAFVSDSLIGYEIGTQPIKRTVSYGMCYIKNQSAESQSLQLQVDSLKSLALAAWRGEFCMEF